jgi:hypothetical protein
VVAFAQGCPAITELLANGWSEVTDEGWFALARELPQMRMFHGDGCLEMSDAAVVEMAKRWHHLVDLNLTYNTKLTNASLRSLHFYARNLQEFRAGGTQIDDTLARKWTEETGRRVLAKAGFYD